MVIVHLCSSLGGRKAHPGSWLGMVPAVAWLYLLCVNESFTISRGDLLEFAGAFLWAAHIMYIAWLSPRTAPAPLVFTSFTACSLCNLIAAALLEKVLAQAVPDFHPRNW